MYRISSRTLHRQVYFIEKYWRKSVSRINKRSIEIRWIVYIGSPLFPSEDKRMSGISSAQISPQCIFSSRSVSLPLNQYHYTRDSAEGGTLTERIRLRININIRTHRTHRDPGSFHVTFTCILLQSPQWFMATVEICRILIHWIMFIVLLNPCCYREIKFSEIQPAYIE